MIIQVRFQEVGHSKKRGKLYANTDILQTRPELREAMNDVRELFTVSNLSAPGRISKLFWHEKKNLSAKGSIQLVKSKKLTGEGEK